MTARLATLVGGLDDHQVVGDEDRRTEVTAVTQDSRAVVDGALYCCVVGRRVDGHDLAGDVIEAGARSLLVERWLDVGVPQVRVPSTRAAVGPVAAAFWGDPSRRLSVVGVTGTNGKTTTTQLIADILRTAGRRTGVVGTLSGERTTPEAPVLQELLAGFVDDQCEAAAMEVSSIALDQRRVDGVSFRVGVFTNLSHDHLDYHHDLETYFESKARLFEPGRCEVAVVNIGDAWGRRLLDRLRISAVTYSVADAADIGISAGGSAFTWRGERIEIALAGEHNIANAIAAASACELLGVAPRQAARGLAAATAIPGRWEAVGAQDFAVVVDYAHTPDGLLQVLTAARRAVSAPARVLVVFGCGGDRDRTKRREMGAVATRLADVAVLTSDNPRTEDPLAIIGEVAAGAERPDVLIVEPDRAAAIERVVADAQAGDVVIIAGKGHETGQVVGDRTLPFDDREVAARALARRRQSRFGQ